MKHNKAKYRISGNAIVLLPYYGYGRGRNMGWANGLQNWKTGRVWGHCKLSPIRRRTGNQPEEYSHNMGGLYRRWRGGRTDDWESACKYLGGVPLHRENARSVSRSVSEDLHRVFFDQQISVLLALAGCEKERESYRLPSAWAGGGFVFFGDIYPEVGKMYGWCRSAAWHYIHNALQKLHERRG